MSKQDKAAAIEYLEQLLKIVRECPVESVDYDQEAEMQDTWESTIHRTKRPTGIQTHTITVVANVGARAEAV